MPARAEIRQLFESIAHRYDRGNRILSCGVDRGWRRHAARIVREHQPRRVLDLCCGSGDLAVAIARDLPAGHRGAGIDLSERMLQLARAKLAAAAAPGQWLFCAGSIDQMPFPDGAFDAATVAFGIRNVEALPRAVAEAIRVLRPGGLFLSLEFSRPRPAVLRLLYHLYLHRLLPRAGGWITGQPAAYRYLADSIRRFPDQPSLAAAYRAAGLDQVAWQNLTGGIAAIHTGYAPGSASPVKRVSNPLAPP